MFNTGKTAGVSLLRIIISACRAIVLTALIVGAGTLTASLPAAGSAPITQQYTCPLPIVGGQPLTASFVPPDLKSATVGVPTPVLPVTVSATAQADVWIIINLFGIASVEGTADVTGELISPQGNRGLTLHLTLPRTKLSGGSGPVTVSAHGVLPSLVLNKPGNAEIIVQGFVAHIETLNSSGGPTMLGQINTSCTLNGGQSDVLGSGPIFPAPSHSPATSLSPTPTPTLSPRRSPSPTKSSGPRNGGSVDPPSPGHHEHGTVAEPTPGASGLPLVESLLLLLGVLATGVCVWWLWCRRARSA